jgi:hypothetical protein
LQRRLRSRGALVALGLAGAALVWIVAAAALWRTSVPDLRLPSIDARRVFGEQQLDRTARFEGFLRVDFLLAQLALVVVLGLYALRGHRLARESAAGPIGTGMLLGMLGLAILWLIQTPFALVDHWWARRHDVSELGYVDWLIINWFALGSEFLFICLALLIVMGLAGWLRFWWWIPGAVVFTGLVALFTFVTPYLIPAQGSRRRGSSKTPTSWPRSRDCRRSR